MADDIQTRTRYWRSIARDLVLEHEPERISHLLFELLEAVEQQLLADRTDSDEKPQLYIPAEWLN
ncbi:MAG TPA: hypothetical protein VGS27_36150 [Candidatus Sulfotelmatobacter sp.]|nr:hypothetical protein [Candidatus Sulfotelmatobacter sp.]